MLDSLVHQQQRDLLQGGPVHLGKCRMVILDDLLGHQKKHIKLFLGFLEICVVKQPHLLLKMNKASKK